MIDFELDDDHEKTRQQVFDSWDEEVRILRDAMPLEQMLVSFEASYWYEERAYQRQKINHARRKLKRRGLL